MMTKCLWCKESKRVYPYQTKKGNGKYCGRTCANRSNAQHLSERRQGRMNPMFGRKPHNFKNGLTSGKSGSRNITYAEIRIRGRKTKIHRLVMQQHIGRQLSDKEVVHHIDGNGQNNDLSNLMLLSDNAEHRRLHLKGGDAQC